MKNLSNNYTRYFVYLVFSFLAMSFTSCSNDDDNIDDGPMEQEPTGSITAGNQTLSGNTLTIDNITVGQDSWLVVRNEGEGTSTNWVADPMFLEAGSHEDVQVELNESANLMGNAEGDDFEVSLHTDNQNTGTPGTFDYDANSGIDDPIYTTNGTAVTQNVNAMAPGFSADNDQMVTENNEVTFSTINTGSTGGYIGLYGQNDDGTINENEMIGMSEYIQPGANENIMARFNDDYQYTAGQTVYPRLFMDDPTDQQFTYTSSGGTEDIPETYGYDTTTGQGQFVGNNNDPMGGFTISNSGGGTATGAGTGN